MPIGFITKAHTTTEFALNPSASPSSIALGPDKNFWITEKRSCAKMTRDTGTNAIAQGPDKRLWLGLLDDLRRIVLIKEGLEAALWNEGRRHSTAPT